MEPKLDKILVLAKPGHFRNSLLALLKTIPRVSLDLRDIGWVNMPEFERLETSLVILDQDLLDVDAAPNIESIKSFFPNAKFMLFTEKIWQPNLFLSMTVDCVLPKSTSTGEFLLAIKQLISSHSHLNRAPTLSSNHLHNSFEPGVVS